MSASLRSRAAAIVAGFVVCLGASATLADEAVLSKTTYRLGWETVSIAGEDRTGPYELGRAPVIDGSIQVFLYGQPLDPDEDYTLRSDRGEITFRHSLAPGDTATATFRFFPLPVSTERFLHKLRLAKGEAPELVKSSPPPAMRGPLDTGNLRVGGSKSFAVIIGSEKELELDQALRVSVNGTLSPDVHVTARLTDQSLPFQPEGRSERLSELDEVFIRIEGPSADATLGDYDVDFAGSAFGRYRRVLEGALGRYRKGGMELELSAGLARGEYQTVEVRGAEGKQGPYILLGRESRKNLVAGSETVWLDGERLVRGEGNDYVIDYADGSVTFNPRRAISSDSRIAVDFQATGDEFKRSFFTERLKWDSSDHRYTLGMTFLREKDDDEKPESIDLSDEDRDSLVASGDRRALVPSATIPESGGGDYDTLGGIFVATLPDSGQFNVFFSDLGEGKGEYVKEISSELGREVFRHAGEEGGRYSPVVPVPLPAEHSLLSIRGGATPLTRLRVSGEIAWSDLDENILSDRDDGDNDGRASTIQTRIDSVALGGGWADLGTVALSGRWRHTGADFASLGRHNNAHRDSRWMTADLRGSLVAERPEDDRLGEGDAVRLERAETIREGDFRYFRSHGIGALTLGGETGALDRSDFDATRSVWRGGLRLPGRYDIGWHDERVRSDAVDTLGNLHGGTVNRSISLGGNLWHLRPSVRFSDDRRAFERHGDLVAGRGSERELYRVEWNAGGRLELESGIGFERSELADSVSAAWNHWFDAVTHDAAVSYRGPVTLTSSYSRRALEYASGAPSGNEGSDVGRFELSHGGWGGAIRGDWSYEVTSEENRTRSRVFVRAPEGIEADYDSLGNHFPGEGNFNLVTVEGDPLPSLDLEVRGSVRLEPGRRRGSEPNRFLAGLRTDTFVRVQERSTARDRAAILLLDPTAFQRNSTTVNGATVARQELRWSDRERDRTVYIRVQREDRERNDFVDRNRDDLVRTVVLRGKSRLSRRFLVEGEWKRRLEEETSNDDEVVDLLSDDLEGRIIFQPDPRWRFRLAGALRQESERIQEEEIRTLRVEPEGTVNLARNGRVSGTLTYDLFLDGIIDRSNSFLRNRREGLRWRFDFAYEWTQLLRSSLSYDGEDLNGLDPQHRLRAEMRAFF